MPENHELILDDFEALLHFDPEYAVFWILIAAYIIDATVRNIASTVLTFTFKASLFVNPGTLGKIAIGVKVVDNDRWAHLFRHSYRAFLEPKLFWSYSVDRLYHGRFHGKKQGFREMIARTLVVKK